MAKFKPGDKRPEGSGRKKGTPNKKTLILSDILEQIDYCPVKELLKLLRSKKLTPRDKAYINLDLMSYLYPKRKAIEVKQETSGTIEFVAMDELNRSSNGE